MTSSTQMRALLVLMFAGLASATADAQSPAYRTHIGHLADAFNGTPSGQGLLPTAMAEAEIVVRHATLAAADPANLNAMKLHAGHVLHAADPTAIASGPGLGYGLKQAAQGVERHAKMIWDDESAPRPVRMYAERVAVSVRNTVERADSISSLARRIGEATTAEAAADLVRQLTAVTAILVPGVDANRDNGIGWRRGEGGLEVTRQHLAVLKRVGTESP
jgi:hypothetical protein